MQCGGLRCEHHQPADEQDLQRWRARKERKSSSSTRRQDSTSGRRERGRDEFQKQDDFISLLEAEEDQLEEEGPLVCADLVPFQRWCPSSLALYTPDSDPCVQ